MLPVIALYRNFFLFKRSACYLLPGNIPWIFYLWIYGELCSLLQDRLSIIIGSSKIKLTWRAMGRSDVHTWKTKTEYMTHIVEVRGGGGGQYMAINSESWITCDAGFYWMLKFTNLILPLLYVHTGFISIIAQQKSGYKYWQHLGNFSFVAITHILFCWLWLA